MKNDKASKRREFLNSPGVRQMMKIVNFSAEERADILKAMLGKDSKKEIYNRVLSIEEKEIIESNAFGYIIHLLLIESIDKKTFEQILNVCNGIYVFTHKAVKKDMIDKILEIIIFTGPTDLSMKQIVDILIKKSDIVFDNNNIKH